MKSSTRSLLIWGAVALGFLLLMTALIKLGTRPLSALGVLSAEVTTEDHQKGVENATITLVEYSDFQCPACASYAQVIKQILEQNPNDFRVVYRHYPLVAIHGNALMASYAATAAHNQGKFWEMHDVLFNTQNQWSNLNDPRDFFIRLAKSLDLNEDIFVTDLGTSATKDRVKKDLSSGRASGVNGTPSLFLNGNEITPSSYADMQTAIDAERNNS